LKKFLYIYLGNFDAVSGVTNKLKDLFSAFDDQKVKWTLFSFSIRSQKPGFITENTYLLPEAYLENKNKIYIELEHFLSLYTEFDIYYFRYPLASFQLLKFVKKHPAKIIFEHNTKELPEVIHQAKYWKNQFRIKITPSYFKMLWLSCIFPVYIERFIGPKILGKAKSGIAVTSEIALYEMNRTRNYKCRVISNGIKVSRISFQKRTFKPDEVLKIIMVANSNVDWHGVDLVLQSFNKYNKNDIKLTLIGNFSPEVKKLASVNTNVTLKGFLTQMDYKSSIDESHIGMGSFALFRKNLYEASTLKVREYFSAGLPVLLGHRDTDIENSGLLKKYSLFLDISTGEVDWRFIYNWAISLYGDENLNKNVREAAFKQLDYTEKVKMMLV
jgi:hypothetical protein